MKSVLCIHFTIGLLTGCHILNYLDDLSISWNMQQSLLHLLISCNLQMEGLFSELGKMLPFIGIRQFCKFSVTYVLSVNIWKIHTLFTKMIRLDQFEVCSSDAKCTRSQVKRHVSSLVTYTFATDAPSTDKTVELLKYKIRQNGQK